MTSKPQKQANKDAIIADLQDEVETLKAKLSRTEDRASTYFSQIEILKSAVSDARKERDEAKHHARQAERDRAGVKSQLRFAEGYIAAIKGDPYSVENVEITHDYTAELAGISR